VQRGISSIVKGEFPMKMAHSSRSAFLPAAVAVLALCAATPALAQDGATCPPDLTAVIGAIAPVECASTTGTDVQLDGTGSSVGTNITYLWTTSDGAVFDDDTSLTPIGTFQFGVTQVTLTVTCTDAAGAIFTEQAMTDVTIQDTTPPTISVELDKTCLWPPNHKYHKINAMVEAEDACDPNPVVALESVVSNEPDNDIGDGNTTEDILLGDDGFSFNLRSERQGPGSGRVYTATYSATDAAGNFTEDSVMITVPHDMGNVDNRALCKSSNKAAKMAMKAAIKAAKAEAKSNNGKAKGKNK